MRQYRVVGFLGRLGSLGITSAATSVVAVPCLALTGPGNPVHPLNPVQRVPTYTRDVRPILAEGCFRCHGPDSVSRKAGLRLDTEEGIRKAFTAGNAAASPAWQRITAADPAQRMPPPGSNLTLSAAQQSTLETWIVQGAKWEKHWAFVPAIRPPLPAIPSAHYARSNPIDRFIAARLEKEGLTPSPRASKETLIRRVTLDLTGLPPTPPEVDAFLADRSAAAYEKVVDRLLISPRFGERWAWEWLEAARYADTNGYQEDRTRTMWPWRDWVVKALNDDMPFDQFTVEQIAGDLLPNATLSQKIATGFNRNHMLNGEGGRIPEESRVDYVMDRVETTGTTWLGVTIGCARCHDHKYDPFTQRDYYSLFAYFNNLPESGAVDRGGSANPVLPLPTPEQSAKLEALHKQITDLNTKLKPLAKVAPERPAAQKELDAAKKALDDLTNAITLVMVMEERPGTPRETHVLIRGDYEKPREMVDRAVPVVLGSPAAAANDRLALARWLVSPQNPLTARVEVNRVWQQLFGTGIVKTQEDFGTQGDPPSHPELLDWLAVSFASGEYVRYGSAGSTAHTSQTSHTPWSLKSLIRLIVTSETYKQSSRGTPALLARDPENRLLARGPRFRLPSAVLRDQALALSGLLVEKLGGPPVKPYQPDGVWEDFSYGKITYQQDHGEALYRRSLYTFWRRSVAPPELFDTAARRVCTVRVTRTNTPLQALTLLNDMQMVEAARVFAQRVMKLGRTPEQRIALMFRMAASRAATPAELRVLVAGYQRRLASYRANTAAATKLIAVGESTPEPSLDAAELAAYTATASVILDLDEVVTRE